MADNAEEIAHFNPHAKGARVGAECLWSRMRDLGQLAKSEELGGFYLISRAADLRKALIDPALFSSAQGITVPDQGVRSRHIPAETDPPLQKEYRNLMARHFGADRVKRMEPEVRRLARGLLDNIAGRTLVDFVDVFARPLPVHVSLALLGLPPSDAELLDRLVQQLHEEVASGVRSGAADRLSTYVRDTLKSRAATASAADDTLVSALLCGRVEGRALTLEEQVSMMRLILIGGFDSTAIALATAVWWLAQNPKDFERLRGEPALIDGFSEEIVRFASPATYLRRTVTRATDFAGTRLQAGDHVVLGFGAANRDPREFPCPESVLLDRKPNNHLGFGFGVHRCIGSMVAKLEMRITIEELLARYSRLELDPGAPVLYSSGLNQGIISLPLILHAGGG